MVKEHLDDAVQIIEFALGLEDGDICIYLSPLSSLLEIYEEIYEDEDGIIFHHSSFMDFMQSRTVQILLCQPWVKFFSSRTADVGGIP